MEKHFAHGKVWLMSSFPIGVILGVYWAYVGRMENKMATTGMIIGYILGVNIQVVLGLYWDNGKQNGNDYLGVKV